MFSKLEEKIAEKSVKVAVPNPQPHDGQIFRKRISSGAVLDSRRNLVDE